MSNLYEVAADILRIPVSEITDETSPKNTRSWDSLKHIELVLAYETSFNVKFAPSEVVMINSIGGVRSLLAQKGVEFDA